ncbi:hypothetical protein BK133_27325 [Paenibacillus sp. FSL H8-0548]|uniref:hypothetical protein n=1 Tax=Paenibacillus sp. FSL H8-0548 TaxID=1920422 RepID=UPI00096CC98C|nr:hypothetical protein [Paenibacillus sp. FSL H8-0548]OMF21938.1 hypothetical protein BK133_27325 [Paenibacillus sp. FSL H8-0548]
MGDTYTNHGQVGAMGKKARASKIIFNQGNTEALNNMNEQQLLLLKDFMNKIISANATEIKTAEALTGAAHLEEFIEASESKETEKQENALSKWHSWLASLKEPSLKFLAITADVVTLSLPLLKLLGLSTL